MGTGGWIVVLVLVLLLIGLAVGFFTEAGSGIALRPWRGGTSPGAKGKEEASGRDEGGGVPIDTHGTK
jgi:hypothetical protein